jgi:sensor histidine kinase regulating citrate/malate metabolism
MEPHNIILINQEKKSWLQRVKEGCINTDNW